MISDLKYYTPNNNFNGTTDYILAVTMIETKLIKTNSAIQKKTYEKRTSISLYCVT